MQLIINGKPRELTDCQTVLVMLERLEIQPTQVAVEINGDIVRRDLFATHAVHQGDSVEILRFVGGG